MKRFLYIMIGAMITMYVHAQTVDVHSHVITPQYIEALTKHNALLDEGRVSLYQNGMSKTM